MTLSDNKNKMSDQYTRLQEIKDKVEEFQSIRGWNQQSPKDFALSLILEAAELLEHFQFKSGKQVEDEARLHGPICDELADVLWWVMAMGNRLGIDVAHAFEVKYAKNETKYPAEVFSDDKTDEEKKRIYYKIKGDYRGTIHPLAKDED